MRRYCKACQKKIDARRYASDPKRYISSTAAYRAKRQDSYRRYKADERRRIPDRTLLRSAKARAKRKGLPFNITVEDIVIPTHCPLLGIPLASGRKTTPNSPSLDRMIPRLGYVKGNVWVISHRANAIKHNATLEELEALARNLRRAFMRSALLRIMLELPPGP